MGSHCLVRRCGIKTSRGSLPRGRGKVEDGEPLPGPKMRNQDQGAGGRGPLVRSNSDLPIYPDLESLSVPKTPIKKRQQEGNLYKSESHCLGSRRPGVRHRLAGATSHKNGETLSGAEKIEGMT